MLGSFNWKKVKKIGLTAGVISFIVLALPLQAGSEDEARDQYKKMQDRAFKDLANGNVREKIDAILFLGGARNHQAIRPLGRELIRDLKDPVMRRAPSNDPYVKSLAAWALARIGHDLAIDDLITALDATVAILDAEAKANEELRKKQEPNSYRIILDRNRPGPARFKPGFSFPASPDSHWSEADEFKNWVAIPDNDEAVMIRLHGYNYLNLAETILFALGVIGGSRAEEKLIPYMENQSAYLRGATAFALARIATTKSIEAVEKRYAKEEDKVVKIRICMAMLENNKTRTTYYKELTTLLRDPEIPVRLEAALALRDLSLGESLFALKDALRVEEHESIRMILTQAINNAERDNIVPVNY